MIVSVGQHGLRRGRGGGIGLRRINVGAEHQQQGRRSEGKPPAKRMEKDTPDRVRSLGVDPVNDSSVKSPPWFHPLGVAQGLENRRLPPHGGNYFAAWLAGHQVVLYQRPRYLAGTPQILFQVFPHWLMHFFFPRALLSSRGSVRVGPRCPLLIDPSNCP